MQGVIRFETDGVTAMAGRWGASAGELSATMAPAGIGLSCQATAAAVSSAHADIAAFAAALAARVSARATGVAEADARYVANEDDAARSMAAMARSLATSRATTA